MSIPGRIYAKLSPKLAHTPGSHLPTKMHAWLIRRTGGRFGTTRFFSRSEVLVIRSTGRKSGQLRESPVIFVEHGDAYVVVASNAASRRMPAWWLNLEAKPEAEILVRGKAIPVRARRATADEERELWPKISQAYDGYEHYREIARREMPVVMLEPQR